ncbi:MAG TPA: recombinase family protein, partial [Gemmatirosa sp.]
RLGRWGDVRRRAALELWFEDRGVHVRYANQPDQPLDRSDTNDPTVIAHVLTDVVESVRNSMELSRIRENTVAERRRRFCRGEYPGPPNVPYGVERVLVDTATGVVVRPLPFRGRVSEPGHHVDLAWAPGPSRQVVRDIFAGAARGESLRGVARMLNARREPTPGARFGPARPGHDRRWMPETVRDILRNPIYVGDVVYGRTMWGRGKHASPGGGPRQRMRRGKGRHFVRRWPSSARDEARASDTSGARGRAEDRWITPEEIARAEAGKDREALAASKSLPIVRRNHMPDPPVSRALFDAVQQILDAREQWAGGGRPSDRFLLTSLVKCAVCGATCFGQVCRPRYQPRTDRPRVAREAYRYYVHHRKDPAGGTVIVPCPHAGRSLPAEVAEAHALDVTRAVLAGPALAGYVRRELAQQLAAVGGTGPTDERVALADAVARAELAHANVANAFADAPRDSDTRTVLHRLTEERAAALQSVRDHLKRYDRRAADLKAASARADAYYAAAQDLVATFEALGRGAQRQTLARVIARVGVFWDAAPDGHVIEVEALALPADDAGIQALLGDDAEAAGAGHA